MRPRQGRSSIGRLARQAAAYLFALAVALAALGVEAALARASLAEAPSVPSRADISARIADMVFPAVLLAVLWAGAWSRTRGSSLLLAAMAFATLLAADRLGARLEPSRPQTEGFALQQIVSAREFTALEEPGAYLYASRIAAGGTLEDVVVLGVSAQQAPRLAYLPSARPDTELRIGPYHLRRRPVRQVLLAPDDSLRSIADEIALLRERASGFRRDQVAAVTLAGALLVFAGVSVLARRSAWPVFGWSLSLLAARGMLAGYRAAFEPQAAATLQRLAGPHIDRLAAFALLAVGLAFVIVDLAADSSVRRAVPRG